MTKSSSSGPKKPALSVSKFKIENQPENSIAVRLSKSDVESPFYSRVEFNRSAHFIIAKNRHAAKLVTKPDAEKSVARAEEAGVENTEASGFGATYRDFISGAFQFVSGSEMLRMEMELTIAAMFHMHAERYLSEHGTKIGKQRNKYAWYVLSDRKFGDLRSELDRRIEKGTFVRDLPSMLIPALVSHFDAFILRTVNDLLKAKPEIANSINKTITVQELLEFSSIEMARAAIVDKEIDSLMRDSHDKHLRWISEKSGVKIEPDERLRMAFFELCERRNIIIHNDGRVNSTYLEKCAKHGVNVDKLKDGEKLDTDAEYFAQSISCLLEMATKISQAVWRNTCPGELENADDALNQFTYSLILRKRYKLAVRLFAFSREFVKKWGSEPARLRNIINHANALRLSGDKAGSEGLLSKEDWTSKSTEFQVCAAAVRENYKECIRLLRKHGEAIGINRISFIEWPVFIGLREDQDFQIAFAEVFGDSLIDDIIAESQKESPNAEPALGLDLNQQDSAVGEVDKKKLN